MCKIYQIGTKLAPNSVAHVTAFFPPMVLHARYSEAQSRPSPNRKRDRSGGTLNFQNDVSECHVHFWIVKLFIVVYILMTGKVEVRELTKIILNENLTDPKPHSHQLLRSG